MDPEWVTIASHDDLEDADWEAAWLVEAGVPATMFEPEDGGPAEIRVHAEYAETARKLLARLATPDEESSEVQTQELSEDEVIEERHRSIRLEERSRLLGRALIAAIFVLALPPAAIYAGWLLYQAFSIPERRTTVEYVEAAKILVIACVGLTIWAALLLG